MSAIVWSTPSRLLRGAVVEATDASPIVVISTVECWEKVASLSETLGIPTEPITVLCEIWPDTGRVIWIQTDRREFCRVELSIPELERKYFEISTSQNFEHDYDQLITQVRNALQNGLKQANLGSVKHIVIRDSDDTTTEVVIM